MLKKVFLFILCIVFGFVFADEIIAVVQEPVEVLRNHYTLKKLDKTTPINEGYEVTNYGCLADLGDCEDEKADEMYNMAILLWELEYANTIGVTEFAFAYVNSDDYVDLVYTVKNDGLQYVRVSCADIVNYKIRRFTSSPDVGSFRYVASEGLISYSELLEETKYVMLDEGEFEIIQKDYETSNKQYSMIKEQFEKYDFIEIYSQNLYICDGYTSDKLYQNWELYKEYTYTLD